MRSELTGVARQRGSTSRHVAGRGVRTYDHNQRKRTQHDDRGLLSRLGSHDKIMVTQSEHGSNNNTTAYKVGLSQPLNTTTHTCDELEHNDGHSIRTWARRLKGPCG
jgi:hypothetical protein